MNLQHNKLLPVMKKILTFLSYVVGLLFIFLSIWLYYISFLVQSPLVVLAGIIISTIGVLSLPYTYRKVKLYYCKSESNKGFKAIYIIVIFFLLIFTNNSFVSNEALKNNLTSNQISQELDEEIIACLKEKIVNDVALGELGEMKDYDLFIDKCLENIGDA